MGQVTIYLEDAIEKKMRSAAKSWNMSQSKWIAQLIREKIVDEWPASIVECAGSWKDLPTAEELRASMGSDVQREKI